MNMIQKMIYIIATNTKLWQDVEEKRTAFNFKDIHCIVIKKTPQTNFYGKPYKKSVTDINVSLIRG